jgi:hypothetical protein
MDEYSQSDAPEDIQSPPITRAGKAHNGGSKGNVREQMARWRKRNRKKRADYMKRWRAYQRQQQLATPCHV